ncbi:fish-egg lectin-like [Lissotriton helveticus]
MVWSVTLLLLALMVECSGAVVSLKCDKISGSLVQIDAGNGLVFGTNEAGIVSILNNLVWTKLQGKFLHVSVGAAGVWAAGADNHPYKMIGGDLVKTQGEHFKKIDAGGDGFLAGVSLTNEVFCLGHNETLFAKSQTVLPWTKIEGKLKYYSCGLKGCWGVDDANSISYRIGTERGTCEGTKWQPIDGNLNMIEVGSRGSVYGVNNAGALYRRAGISDDNPIGKEWEQLDFKSFKIKHVSEDMDRLWLVLFDQKVYTCTL